MQTAIQSVRIAANYLSDAAGHLADVKALLGPDDATAKAFAAYRAATAPATIRRVLAATKGKPYASLITIDGIRSGALDQLVEDLGAAR